MISSFDGDYKFLSNFYPVTVYLDGLPYRSVEHAYQAAKTDVIAIREQIQGYPSAGQAKKRGGELKYVRADWAKVKVRVMEQLLEQKFREPKLRQMLLDTDPHELVEGNYWGDVFWGVYNGKGKNNLGKLLMAIRSGIQMGLY